MQLLYRLEVNRCHIDCNRTAQLSLDVLSLLLLLLVRFLRVLLCAVTRKWLCRHLFYDRRMCNHQIIEKYPLVPEYASQVECPMPSEIRAIYPRSKDRHPTSPPIFPLRISSGRSVLTDADVFAVAVTSAPLPMRPARIAKPQQSEPRTKARPTSLHT